VIEADRRPKRTKLICTLGPATVGREAELIDAGMDVARLNFSHGTAKARVDAAAAVRKAARAAGRPVAILADLAGPKIRIGAVAGGSLDLPQGASLVLSARRSVEGGDADVIGDARRLMVDYPGLATDVRAGDRVLLADGAAELRVERVEGDDVLTEVVRGGTIRSRTGVSIPSDRRSGDPLTAKDRADVLTLATIGADYVAQSFVRRPEDVAALRDLLGPDGPLIIAKIETRSAMEHFDGILDLVDAVMIARGDLGVELPYEEVPLVQKQLVRRALDRGVPTIVATQMLESMIEAPRPTRAEASDVANAVFDGADAIMLSGETAIGAFPVLAAEAAGRIAHRCEEQGSAYLPDGAPPSVDTDAGSLAYAAVALADAETDVMGIACYTRSGRTARLLSSLRPGVPIYAFSPDPAVVSRLALVHGVVPLPAQPTEPTARLALLAELVGRLAEPIAHPAEPRHPAAVVLVASTSVEGSGPNLLELHRLPA